MINLCRNLRERIYKEAIEFMKNQLINCLTNGSWFQNYSAKGRTKGYRFFKVFFFQKFQPKQNIYFFY